MTSAARACLRATFWGSMTGGGPFLIITLPFGISISKSGDLLGTLVVALLPLIVSGTVVTGAFILFGLPLTAVLARGEDEDATTYAAAGAGLGMLLPLTFAVYHGGFVAGPGPGPAGRAGRAGHRPDLGSLARGAADVPGDFQLATAKGGPGSPAHP